MVGYTAIVYVPPGPGHGGVPAVDTVVINDTLVGAAVLFVKVYDGICVVPFVVTGTAVIPAGKFVLH